MTMTTMATSSPKEPVLLQLLLLLVVLLLFYSDAVYDWSAESPQIQSLKADWFCLQHGMPHPPPPPIPTLGPPV